MEIIEALKTVAALIGALAAIGGAIVAVVVWVQKPKKNKEEISELSKKHDKEIEEVKKQHNQDVEVLDKKFTKEIELLKKKHSRDTDCIQEEQTLVIYGLLACLKGLAAQGCNGPVSEAIDKIEKHINQKAHGQE